MLLDQFLGGADVLPSPVFLAVRGATDQVLVIRRHDVIQIRRNLDAFFAHIYLLSALLRVTVLHTVPKLFSLSGPLRFTPDRRACQNAPQAHAASLPR
jgi:hypothetical protein